MKWFEKKLTVAEEVKHEQICIMRAAIMVGEALGKDDLPIFAGEFNVNGVHTIVTISAKIEAVPSANVVPLRGKK